MNSSDTPLLSVCDLSVAFGRGEREALAVDRVSFDIRKGETLALVGESGSGKSVTSYAVMRILDRAGKIAEGSVMFSGIDVKAATENQMRDLRGREISMIFQNPRAALNPIRKVGDQIEDVLRQHVQSAASDRGEKAIEALEQVKIARPRERYHAYPFELSGGMCQRVVIALALACKPRILLADEPTTALDATVQIQILLLLRELQREFGMSVIFVTHDIGVAIEICDRVAVMYAGQIVEQGTLGQIVRSPIHPYARGLLASTVHGAKRGQRLETIPGTPPSLDKAPSNCSFAPRCGFAEARCVEQLAPNVQVGNRIARCILAIRFPT